MRDTFIFYRSFYEAAKTLSDADRLTLYDTIAGYALDEKEPEASGVALGMFLLMKPVIDANTQRYENGKKGGRKPNPNQSGTETEPKRNRNGTEAEPYKDKDKYKDKYKDKDKDKDVYVSDLMDDMDDMDDDIAYWDRVLKEETA